MTPGKVTTEFKMTVVVNVIAAILTVLGAYGLLTQGEQQVWLSLGQAIVVAVGPIVMGYVTAAYAKSRSELKVADLYSNNGGSKNG